MAGVQAASAQNISATYPQHIRDIPPRQQHIPRRKGAISQALHERVKDRLGSPSYMASSSSPSHPPHDVYSHYYAQDMSANALIASTIQGLDQRNPPSMQEILAAFTTKGDGDREMLFALLNAKAAEDNRIAAEKNLRRSLLELCRGPAAPYMSSVHLADTAPYPLPSPPTSQYRDSPHSRRRASLSASSSHSSDEAYSDAAQPRKRRRSRSPNHEHRFHTRRSHDSPLATRSDAPLPPSPYSSASSSQSNTGSPRSRESMAIGALLSTHDRSDLRTHQAHNISYARRDDEAGRSRS